MSGEKENFHRFNFSSPQTILHIFLPFVLREGEDSESDEESKKKKIARPEDCIPDLPENATARNFLKNAPTKGLWLPMGQEVKGKIYSI
jgi:hypothetical protein